MEVSAEDLQFKLLHEKNWAFFFESQNNFELGEVVSVVVELGSCVHVVHDSCLPT